MTVLEQALARLREEFQAAGRVDFYDQLQSMLTAEGSQELYARIADQFAMSVGAVKAAVHRLRQRYGQMLREEVAHTVAHPGEVDEELRHLVALLAA